MPYVIIVSRYKGRWVFVQHKDRSTYEMPAGHIEPGEDITSAAKRELYEETGAADFSLSFVSAYTVTAGGSTSGGYLYFAEIHALSDLPDSEIGRVALFTELPDKLTYPDIQPHLFEYVRKRLIL